MDGIPLDGTHNNETSTARRTQQQHANAAAERKTAQTRLYKTPPSTLTYLVPEELGVHLLTTQPITGQEERPEKRSRHPWRSMAIDRSIRPGRAETGGGDERANEPPVQQPADPGDERPDTTQAARARAKGRVQVQGEGRKTGKVRRELRT